MGEVEGFFFLRLRSRNGDDRSLGFSACPGLETLIRATVLVTPVFNASSDTPQLSTPSMGMRCTHCSFSFAFLRLCSFLVSPFSVALSSDEESPSFPGVVSNSMRSEATEDAEEEEDEEEREEGGGRREEG